MKNKLILLFMLLILITGCVKKVENPKIEIKKNQAVKTISFDDKKIENLEIKDAKITESDGISVFTANVFNVSQNEENIESVIIKLKDKDNNDLISLIGYIGGTIKSNDHKQIISNLDLILDDVEIVEYEIERF